MLCFWQNWHHLLSPHIESPCYLPHLPLAYRHILPSYHPVSQAAADCKWSVQIRDIIKYN